MPASDILVNCVYMIVQVTADAYLDMQEHILQEKVCLSQKYNAIEYEWKC